MPSNIIGFRSKGGGERPITARGKARTTRVDSSRGRFYDITGADGATVRVPSITHVLGKGLPKGYGLERWIKETEKQAAVDAAGALYEELRGQVLPVALFKAGVVERLGKTPASDAARDAAGAVGTEAHAFVAWDLKRRNGGPAEAEPRLTSAPAERAVREYQRWAAAHDLDPVAVEQVAYSLEYGLAGTLDALVAVDGVLTVLDLKTGKAVYGEARLQVGFYAYALLEMGVAKTMPAGLVLRLPKRADDPTFEAVEVATAGSGPMGVVLAARAIWAWSEAEAEAARLATKERKTEMRPADVPAVDQVRTAAPVATVAVAHHGTAPRQAPAAAAALTHHVWHDTPGGRGPARATCGAPIERAASVAAPTCPTCARALAQYEQLEF